MLFLLLIGLKICEREFYVYANKIYATTCSINHFFNQSILQEVMNLNRNSVDNIANTITTLKAEKNFCFLVQKMNRHFPKQTFTERRTSENPSSNSETGHPRARPLYKLHPTKAANRFHIHKNCRTAKRKLW